MRRIAFTLSVVWASLCWAADPAAPVAAPAIAAPPAAATPTPAGASARDVEREFARELAAKNTDGRAVPLAVAGREVQALYLPQSAAKAEGALLLLHDFGGHADWPGVVAPLRRALPPVGWSTLSVQLPLPGKGLPAAERSAWLDGVPPRIDAALEFLKSEGQQNVVLVGHGLGAVAALDYLVAHPERARGAVLLSLPHLRGVEPRLTSGELLGRLTLPVLDLYGTADLDEIAATAPLRRTAAGHRGNYLQVAIPGADHFFSAQGTLLSTRVRGWLARHTGDGPNAADPTNQPTTENQGNPP